MNKLKQALNLISNMGMRYVLYRVGFELRKKTGLLKKKFPVNQPIVHFISLKEWKNLSVKFFFQSNEEIEAPKRQDNNLQENAEKILEGTYTFFSSIEYRLGKNYNWITNPDTGFVYDISKHWTEINDYSKEAGDIKFVWEKSRFSFLYELIRYDYHFQKDTSHFVFSEIENWIDSNPVNMGPNYKCSQEMSLRILNWTYALHYFKNSSALTEQLFEKIINIIYRQAQHVFGNINFSRIAVRNNHAITETLALYLVGLLFPFFPESKKWKQKGKQWFEEEIAYQVYPDGTFLQFSMNYHRVVVQLLTWGLALAKANNETFGEAVYKRAEASYNFLTACINDKDGNLPNYGANDGALFFPLNNNEFRDYRPQLESLGLLLGKGTTGNFEDKYWYCIAPVKDDFKPIIFSQQGGVFSFKNGGYYILREIDAMTFIRCGNHKDRPSQADNLHLDIWAGGENILRDAGSYKYNTDEDTIRFFFGTASHNTVMLNGYDQMLKGNRFIWYNWSGPAKGNWKETTDYFEFAGEIEAFKHIAPGIIHKRIVKKYKGILKWEIIDEMLTSVDLPIHQLWNPSNNFNEKYIISAKEKDGSPLTATSKPGWYSGKYGYKEPISQIIFTSTHQFIHTTIQSKQIDLK